MLRPPRLGGEKSEFTAEAHSTLRFLISNSPLSVLRVSAVRNPSSA
jgi:hypothetical protein